MWASVGSEEWCSIRKLSRPGKPALNHSAPPSAHRSGARKVRLLALVKSRRGQVASWTCGGGQWAVVAAVAGLRKRSRAWVGNGRLAQASSQC